jgi:hypothetical protein
MKSGAAGWRNDPYLLINIILTGVIIAIMIYSGIFSPDKDSYPIVCLHKRITGLPCASCGLSHSFSYLVRGRITEAYQANVYGMGIFLFFAAQLLMRPVFSVIYLKNESFRKAIIPYDIAISLLLFAIAFYPFFRQIIYGLKM